MLMILIDHRGVHDLIMSMPICMKLFKTCSLKYIMKFDISVS